MVGHRLENSSDGFVQLLRQTRTLGGLFNLHSEKKKNSFNSKPNLQCLILKKNKISPFYFSIFLWLMIKHMYHPLQYVKTGFLLNIQAVRGYFFFPKALNYLPKQQPKSAMTAGHLSAVIQLGDYATAAKRFPGQDGGRT